MPRVIAPHGEGCDPIPHAVASGLCKRDADLIVHEHGRAEAVSLTDGNDACYPRLPVPGDLVWSTSGKARPAPGFATLRTRKPRFRAPLPPRRAAWLASSGMNHQEATVGHLLKLATAFAAGAMTMYMLDPAAGRRRRAMARDKAVAAGHDMQDFVHDTARHAADRLHGAVAQRHGQDPTDDEQLHNRIRSKLGHLVAQPGKVEVHVEGGLVTLNGSARLSEVDKLVAAVADMLGVERIDNRLDTEQATPPGQSTH